MPLTGAATYQNAKRIILRRYFTFDKTECTQIRRGRVVYKEYTKLPIIFLYTLRIREIQQTNLSFIQVV